MTVMTAPPISIRKGRAVQPQLATNVNWGNPITRGLAMLTSFGASALDAKCGQLGGIEAGASIGTTQYGMALRPGSGPAGLKPANVTDANSFLSATEFTVMMLVRINSLGTRRIFLADYNVAGSIAGISFEQTATNLWWLQMVTTIPQAIPSVAPVGTSVTTGWHWCEVTFKQNTAFNAYIDGVVQYNSVATDVNNPRRAGADYRIGRPGAYPGLPFDGDIAFHGCWNRLLSDQERATVRGNPWQLLAPVNAATFSLATGHEPISVRQSVLLPTSGPIKPTVAPITLRKNNNFPNIPIINKSNQLTKGLLLCAVPIQGGFIDLVTGMIASQPSTASFKKTTRQQDPILPYAKYNSTAAFFPNRTLLDNHTGPYTLFIDGCLETNGSFATILSSYDTINGIGMYLFLDDSLTVVNTFVLSSFNTGHQNAGSVLGTNSEQFSHRLMVTADGSNWKFYAANQLVRTIGLAELPGVSTLRQTYVNNGGSSRIVAAWNRPLSLLEYSSLYNNPYQLFSTSTPHLWGNI